LRTLSNQEFEMKLLANVIVAILMWYPQGARALCVQGDCTNGEGTFVLSDGTRYVGEFRENVRTGRGLMTYPDGTKYEGDWQNGKPHGKGTLSSGGKFEYRGEFANGVRHGQGTLETVDGKKYLGQWQNDVPHGQGRIIYPGREEFVGNFKNGRRHGQGEVTYSDGSSYKGLWAEGSPNGQGVKILSDGMQYSGEFKNGFMHGRGSIIMPDGSQIKIQLQNDVPVQKEENQTEAAFSTVEAKGDWYMVPTPKETQDRQSPEPPRPEGHPPVSSQESSADKELTTRQEMREPVVTEMQIFPQAFKEKQAAVEEQTQTEAVSEIQMVNAKEVVSEPVMSGNGEHASGPKDEYAQTSDATSFEEYASIGQVDKGANIRSDASLSAEVLRSVPPGYPLVVKERQVDWVLVEDFRKRKGWVFASLLTEWGTVIIKVWKGNLRSGPSLTDEIIVKLDHGTVMTVVETRGDWLKVSNSNRITGWLHRQIIWP
jgi:SH3-like domain-containing protein